MIELPLNHGYFTLVNDDDAARVLAAGRWIVNRCGKKLYAGHSVKRDGRWQNERLHTFLTGWALVDHVNGDGLDNRRENLRAATPLQNVGNLFSPLNTSGFKGVGRYRNGRWRAYISRDRRHVHLGYFDTPEEAARAYDAAASEHFGEFARLNFPLPEEQAS